ncbi:hypothetical protein N8659_01070, partial [bacterium]|nr:hypothetical protein [bacterium]
GGKVPEVPADFVKSLQEEVAKVDSGDEEIVVDWKVAAGEEVEIAEGPFKGMSGEVVEVRPGGERVGLLLEFLGEQQTIEVSLYSLILAGPEIPAGWQEGDST